MSAGKTLQSLKTSIATVTDTWATAAGVQSPAKSERLGRTLVGLSALLAVALTFFPLGSSLFVIPFAAFTVGAIGLLVPGVGRRRTLLGRDVWSKAGGFERLLSTDSAKDRFDFSGKRELYTAFIPFAVAFDCAERWARKYEKATGAEAPIPHVVRRRHVVRLAARSSAAPATPSPASSHPCHRPSPRTPRPSRRPPPVEGAAVVVAVAAEAAVAEVPGKPVLITIEERTP